MLGDYLKAKTKVRNGEHASYIIRAPFQLQMETRSNTNNVQLFITRPYRNNSNTYRANIVFRLSKLWENNLVEKEFQLGLCADINNIAGRWCIKPPWRVKMTVRASFTLWQFDGRWMIAYLRWMLGTHYHRLLQPPVHVAGLPKQPRLLEATCKDEIIIVNYSRQHTHLILNVKLY